MGDGVGMSFGEGATPAPKGRCIGWELSVRSQEIISGQLNWSGGE